MLCITGVALAQTGGSMGGGNWGGGGGGGGYSDDDRYTRGGGGTSTSTSSSSGGWSRSSSSSSGGGSDFNTGGCRRPDPYWTVGIMLVLTLVGVVRLVRSGALDLTSEYSRKRVDRLDSLDSTPGGFAGVDVTVLRVAVDGRARHFVQTELMRIAKIADTATEHGRSVMLREVSMLLRKLRDAWVYGGAINEPMRDIRDAKGSFDKHVDDTRARFREEVIRNTDGSTQSRAASVYTPRHDEGAGLILVSVIVAARRELFSVQRIGDGDDLRCALESASQLTPDSLVAIEIVWQPAEDADRLSSMELEAKYPPPELHAIRGALVGKAFCTHCAGPFPAELVSCPHCGAPAPGREQAAA